MYDNDTNADVPTLLGTSATHDIAPLCEFDVMSYHRGEKKVASIAELDAAIVPSSSATATSGAAALPEKEDDEFSSNDAVDVTEYSDAKEEEAVVVDEAEKETAPGEEEKSKVETGGGEAQVEVEVDLGNASKEEGEEETPALEQDEIKVEVKEEVQNEETTATTGTTDVLSPVCTVKLRVAYTPSKKDQEEKLYDLLNQASKRKAQAIERLRKSAAAVSRSRAQSTIEKENDGEGEEAAVASSRALQPGFLNKKKRASGKTTVSNFFINVYNRILGPQSLFVQVFPIARNYGLFFGIVAFAHWKGDLLALPAPL